jgi:hypothetical protein
MKKKSRSLSQLIETVRQMDRTFDEEAPFGFAQRLTAQWRAMRKPESFLQALTRLINPALACSWAIATMSIFYAWQAESLPIAGDSTGSSLYDNYYSDQGEETIWPQANG